MFSETIEVSVTYGKKLTFFLRMIGITEENALRQRAFGLSDEEKAEKEYQTNVDILAELSTKLPDGMFEDGVIPKGPTDAVIRTFFSDRNVVKERIAFYGVRGYFVRLQPEESFL